MESLICPSCCYRYKPTCYNEREIYIYQGESRIVTFSDRYSFHLFVFKLVTVCYHFYFRNIYSDIKTNCVVFLMVKVGFFGVFSFFSHVKVWPRLYIASIEVHESSRITNIWKMYICLISASSSFKNMYFIFLFSILKE